jgi:hypothetical protein
VKDLKVQESYVKSAVNSKAQIEIFPIKYMAIIEQVHQTVMADMATVASGKGV